MLLTIELGPEYKRTLSSLQAAAVGLPDALRRGMALGVKSCAQHVGSEYLSGQYLKRRTGNLARAVDGWMIADDEAVIGVRDDAAVGAYKWMLGSDSKTIRPTRGKYLTIPVGEALTGAGVLKAKYANGLRAIEGGFFVRSKEQLLFGYKVGKRGRFRPLFVLVKEVTIHGSGALYDGVEENLNLVTDAINAEIKGAIGN